MSKLDRIQNPQQPDFSRTVTPKAWGWEYECYNNGIVSVWILNVHKGEATSLHMHPNKLTGLAVLGGTVRLNFLNASRKALALDKTRISVGFFHQTEALTDAVVLEIETPINKYDLVRLSDKYGREGQPYESPSSYTQRDGRHPNLTNDNTEYVIGESELMLRYIGDEPTLCHYAGLAPEGMSVFLRGGLITDENVPVVSPGHIVWNRNFETILQIASPTEDTEIISIRRFKPNG